MLLRLASWCEHYYEVGFECAHARERVPWRSEIARVLIRLGIWRFAPPIADGRP